MNSNIINSDKYFELLQMEDNNELTEGLIALINEQYNLQAPLFKKKITADPDKYMKYDTKILIHDICV